MAQALSIATLLTVAGIVATSISGFRATPGPSTATHILLALATVSVGLFAQSMTMFFFIGTGKQIKTKVKGIPEESGVVAETRRFKNEVFPAAMWAIGALMVTFILGGGVHTGSLPIWLHQLTSLVTLLLVCRAWWIEIRAMASNQVLMERFLREES
ncbi:MAG TPA: hypothetical protein VMS56_05555 [Thermoanaerobaculia bacterium]|nr:hypothetical protein [Thermoanaerobaculia bacterium]